MTEFEKALKSAIYKTVDFRGRPATVGKQDGTCKVTAENGTVYKDRIWVTYTDTGTKLSETIVRRNKVPFVPQMPIIVKDIRGIPTAFADDGAAMEVYSNNGNSVPTDAHQHYLEGPNPEYVEDRRFMPVGAHPSEPPALTVYIEPGFYRYHGTMKAWQGGTSGSLSSYVPVVDDGRIHFVIIALDRSDNSIDIIDGDDVPANDDPYFPANAVVTYDDILAIAIDAKYMPLAVVELIYGQTAVKVKDITFDHRLWGGEVPTPGVAGGVQLLFSQTADGVVANTTTPTELLSTGVGSVTLPANTLETGAGVRVFMAGHLSTTGTPDFELSVELGGLELASTGVNTLASNLTTVGWRLWLDLVCRTFPSTGSIVASGVWRLGDSLYGLVNTSTTTVDPADPLQIEVIAAWGTADPSNTITAQIATIELLPVTGL